MFLTRVLDSQRAGRFFKRSQYTHITKPHLQATWNDFTNYRFGDPGCRKCSNPIFNYKCIIPQNPTCYSRMLDEAHRFCAPFPGQIGISVETSGRTLLLPVSRCDCSWNNFRILPGHPERARRHPQNTGTLVL